MNHAHNKQSGFTLIELTLAMLFISFLLLGIALTVIQIGGIYTQGTTAKEINQTSRDISDDLNRTIAASGPLTLSTDYMLRPSATSPAGGRLCLGTYSYVWNYAKAISGNNANVTKYLAGPDGTTPEAPIRLIKVPDPGKLYCIKSGTAFTYANIRSVDTPKAQELLKAGDRELGIHDLSFITPVPASATDSSTGRQLYSLSYTIGTSNVTAMNATQTACLAAGTANADTLYCNVQKFNLVISAGNGVN